MSNLKSAHAPVARPSVMQQAVEYAADSLIGGRAGIFFGPMAISTLFWLWRRPATVSPWPVVIGVALSSAWYLAWMRTSWERPAGGRTIVQALFTLVGAVMLGWLGYQQYAFVLVAATMYPRFFLTMPYRWSFPTCAVMVMPAYLGVGAPGTNPEFVVRLLFLAIAGVFLRAFADQLDSRRRLAEQLAQAERRAGRLEERQHLARDIHDSLAQGFAGIVAHLETAELEQRRNPAEASRHTGAAVAVARHSLEEARRMMGAMLPEALDGRDLVDALTRLAADWSDRTGVACEAVVTGEARALHRDLEVAVLRIAQEALSNVWRHARAAHVTMSLTYLDDVIVLDVRDDGQGIADAAPRADGFGLRGMRERVEALGGTFALESAPGDGTTVSATIPALPSDTGAWRTPAGARAP